MARKQVQLTTYRIGTPAAAGQGLRLGVTRRPPRGVPKARWVADGLFDVWVPALAPSAELLKKIHAVKDPDERAFTRFFDAYERELLGSAEGRGLVELLALVALRTPLAIGCFCEDESRCHRSRLARMIRQYAPATG